MYPRVKLSPSLVSTAGFTGESTGSHETITGISINIEICNSTRTKRIQMEQKESDKASEISFAWHLRNFALCFPRERREDKGKETWKRFRYFLSFAYCARYMGSLFYEDKLLQLDKIMFLFPRVLSDTSLHWNS